MSPHLFDLNKTKRNIQEFNPEFSPGSEAGLETLRK